MKMFRLLACLALLGQLYGLSLPQLIKIYGGNKAPIEGYPFLVNLRRGGRFKCGGFLATPSCVITAAHCLEGRHHQLHDLTVHAHQQCLGDESASGDVRNGWFSLVSPHYCPPHGVDSDVAVIRLRQPFNIRNEERLPQIDFNELPEGANLTVAGWGMTNDYYHHWNQCLQAAHVGLVPQDTCRLAMRHTITSNMFCAIGEWQGRLHGRLGGPILQAGRPVGVVSWGYSCGSGFPGVYTRLSSPPIKHWLQSLLDRHCRV